jgi:hypothetical protein
MKILNLTPHPITIRKKDSSEITIKPSGIVWRLKEEDVEITRAIGLDTEGIEVVARRFSVDMSTMPQEVWASDIVIVSLPMLLSLKAALSPMPTKPLVCAPDTGSGAIRDEQGRIIGTTRLITI